MPFEIHLRRPGGGEIDGGSLRQWVAAVPGLAAPEGGAPQDPFVLPYANPRTGVRGALAFAPDAAEAPTVRLTLHYLRPTFHAREMIELAASLAASLGLEGSVDDGRAASAPSLPAPGPIEVDALVEAFAGANAAEVRHRRVALAGRLPLVLEQYLPRERADAWWHWARLRAGFKRALGQGVTVPTILILREPRNRRLFTAVSWPSGGAMVFPPVDRVFLMRGVQGSSAESMEMVALDEALGAVHPHLDTIEAPIPVHYLPALKAASASLWFQTVEGKPGAEDLEQVEPEAFTDVPFES